MSLSSTLPSGARTDASSTARSVLPAADTLVRLLGGFVALSVLLAGLAFLTLRPHRASASTLTPGPAPQPEAVLSPDQPLDQEPALESAVPLPSKSVLEPTVVIADDAASALGAQGSDGVTPDPNAPGESFSQDSADATSAAVSARMLELGDDGSLTAASASSPTELPEPNEVLADQGVASTYGQGDGFQGRTTACGQTFDTHVPQVAHKTLPCGTLLRVEDVDTGRSVTVPVTDRGPYIPGRVVDLSWAAFQQLDPSGPGLLNVKVYEES